jgi:uroporphyrinogen decarboxylase
MTYPAPADASHLHLSSRERMLAALRLEPVDRPPIWFMRQAGRHLPRYRALRERLSFLELCSDEEVNSIASLEPWERYKTDGVIVFNDILIPLRDMGMGLKFSPGPQFDHLISTVRDAEALGSAAYGPQTDVSRCISTIRKSVGARAAVLGFIGAPFTVAGFAIAGAGRQRRAPLAKVLSTHEATLEALQHKLVTTLAAYASVQIDAGADVIQVFESLAADVPVDVYRRVGLPRLLQTVRLLRTQHPTTPVIVFARGLWPFIADVAASGVSCISLDETRSLTEARHELASLGLTTALQGNLNPKALLAPASQARREARELVRRWREIVPFPDRSDELGPTGWVFNLGHGVPEDASPQTVRAVMGSVRQFFAETEPLAAAR